LGDRSRPTRLQRKPVCEERSLSVAAVEEAGEEEVAGVVVIRGVDVRVTEIET